MSSQADEWPLTNLPPVRAGCPCPHPGHLRTCPFYQSGAPSQAYGEPWMVVPPGGPQGNWPGIMSRAKGWIIVDRVLSDNHPPTGKPTTKNTERIIACVNACAGIANPAAVAELIEACRVLKESWTEHLPDGSERIDPSIEPEDERLIAALAVLNSGQEERR